MPMPSQEPFEEESADDVSLPMGSLPDVTGKSLEEFLGSAGETFQQRLFELIDASGMDDVTVYKKANIDRKVFSRIRCKEDYRPKKKTAVAFAIALELDMPTTVDLLSRAEIAFSRVNGPPGTACITKKVIVMTAQMVTKEKKILFTMYRNVLESILCPPLPIPIEKAASHTCLAAQVPKAKTPLRAARIRPFASITTASWKTRNYC